MEKLNKTTLFLWVFVIGIIVSILSMTMCTNAKKAPVPDDGDNRTYYERFEEDLRNNVKIIDTTESCAEELEEIYRDNKTVYYLPCVKSKNITIRLADGNEYPLRVALENELVTIAELKTLGLKMFAEPINKNESDITYIEID